ncbi:DUF4136 domain-containing protein [Chitinophaga solisilvae]|uniref:DUF4136 domain-containing protein n=1 Tax=Chitinophaga solisilvae TaxID=1233460 RepID=UPI00136DE76D|nr:DUF4136 domain-containing protein [Chitinophaga solisilvae]
MRILTIQPVRRYMAVVTAVTLIFLMAACGTTVHMTGTWKDASAAPGGYHEIMVAGLSSNVNARQTVENQLAAALGKYGVTAGKSLDVFPPSFDPKNDNDREAMAKKVEAAGYKAILTVSLVNKEAESRYVPGTVSYAPYPVYGWYGNFWRYYGYMYSSVYSPGYYTTDKTYFLESNLYDLDKEGKLVWSGQSETVNPNSLESFAAAYGKVVADALKNGGLLR